MVQETPLQTFKNAEIRNNIVFKMKKYGSEGTDLR